VGGGAALCIAYLCTPLAIRAARRFAFYDFPAGYKDHGRPTPYLGGTAVMAAFALALLAGAGHPASTLPLVGGVAVLVGVGTLDDRRPVSPLVRVAVEILVGILLSLAGLGWHLGAGGAVDAAVTAVWVVGVVNAFNLFDNMDGAASTMAFVVAAGVCGLSLVNGDVWVAASGAALCGACLGFLPHNLSSPAKIFLGDGGSMPLGLAVAILVARASHGDEPSAVSLLVGFLLVGIPILDTSLVVISRRRRGISVLTGGRDHLTHRVRQRLGTPRRVALVLGGVQALVSGLVILASRDSPSTLVYIVLAFVVFGAATIAGLEDAMSLAARLREPSVPSASAAPTFPTQTFSRSAAADGGWTAKVPDALLALIGLGAGLSPLLSAYYSTNVWIPMGLVLVVGTAMAAIARPPVLTLPVLGALGGLIGLGLFSLVSSGWANDAESAVIAGNLWLTYAAFLLLAMILIRRPRHLHILLGAAGVGVVAVGATVLVRMLGSQGVVMFLGGRLNSPLGYINGEGCVFAMGAWFSLALAERREPLLAAAGAASAVAMGLLALLTQSRGAAVATLVAIVLALAVVPGFRRRVLALAVVAAGIGVAAPAAAHIYRTAGSGSPPASVVHHASAMILICALGAGLLWGAIVGVEKLLDRRGPSGTGRLRRVGTVLAVLLFVAPFLAAAIRASSLEHTLSNQWHAFVNLAGNSQTGSGAATRLFSGGGNRYDYWRVAWHVFSGHPVAGVGAGNFSQYYFLERRTTEAIQNPHSLELQVLSELGIVGVLFLSAFVLSVAVAVWRLRAIAARSRGNRMLMLGAVGAFVVWLVDTSGDWMHLLPGTTATALCAAAVILRARGVLEPAVAGSRSRPTRGTAPAPRSRLPGRLPAQKALVAAAALAFVLAASGASLARSALAQHYLNVAHHDLTSDPASAVTEARNSLKLDSANLNAYYELAAGQARFDQAVAARRTLLSALHEDPSEYVTFSLLGDLEVRAGHLRLARSYYHAALRLDPREPSLRVLARNPSAALHQ
jgi:UDP-GlcNAc:undecaprenyl-phosphate GlcNAc-1-phosphate transferase